MPVNTHRSLWLLICTIIFVISSKALACQVCFALPEKTLADHLLESDLVLLAREDPERPFLFAITETLKGKPSTVQIDAFLNSRDRRILEAYEDHHVLIAGNSSEDTWKILGVTDHEMEAVIRRIISFSDTWRPMETANPERLAEFSKLLGHPNRRLHELAYLEIGRAPYSSIRRVSASVPVETVRDILDNPRYLEWQALAILMLGQSEKPEDQARVVRVFETRQQQSSSLNLAAWTTAYIAIEGNAGMDSVESAYLINPNRNKEELTEVIKALSVLGSDDPALRDRIVSAYASLLRTHPGFVANVVKDLIAWRRWKLVGQVQEIRNMIGTDDPLRTYSIDMYLRMASERGTEPGEGLSPP